MSIVDLKEILSKIEPIRKLPDKDVDRLWLVGGSIRDAILNREILDFDFAVDGNVKKIAKNFASSAKTSYIVLHSEFDECRVVYKKKYVFDFATFRGENIEQDLIRRDFTINSLALRLKDIKDGNFNLIDPKSGLDDLSSGMIRVVDGNSFKDDPLRILRAFRFSSQLDFKIDKSTLTLASQNAESLSKVSKERIMYELFLILENKQSWRYIEEMAELGIFFTIFKDAERLKQTYPELDLWEHSLSTLKELEGLLLNDAFMKKFGLDVGEYLDGKKIQTLKLGALFHDIAKPWTLSEDEEGTLHFYGHDLLGVKMVRSIFKDMKLSNREIDAIALLVRHHMRPHLLAREEDLSTRAMRRFLRDIEGEAVGSLLIAYADVVATNNGDVDPLEKLLEKFVKFKREEEKRKEFKRLIDGNDLIENLHLIPGTIFKTILSTVEEEQLEGKIHTKQQALELARKIVKKETTAENTEIEKNK